MGYDGGYYRFKSLAIDITGRTSHDVHSDSVVSVIDRSVYSPLPADVTNIQAIVNAGDGVCGLVGTDATSLCPTLWQGDSTEGHYGSNAQKLFVRSTLMRMFLMMGFPSGSVDVYLTMSIAGMHSQYASVVSEALGGSFRMIASSGEEWHVRMMNVEVRPQTFLLAVDLMSQWDAKTGTLRPFNVAPIMQEKYPLFIDFGSMTFQAAAYLRNIMNPVVSWCEGVGTWEQVRDDLKVRLQRAALSQHIRLFDPTMQELMSCYESGVFTRGKHVIDMSAEIAEMVRPKAEQRVKIAEQQLRGGGKVGNIWLAGGDVSRNIEAFTEAYQDNISGSIRIMENEYGQPEPHWRVASGGVKASLKTHTEMEVKTR